MCALHGGYGTQGGSGGGSWGYDSNGNYVYTYNGGALEEVVVYGQSSISIQNDSSGRSYYVDNTGRVHYVMDSGLLWEGVKNIFTSFSTYGGIGYEAIKGQLGMGIIGGLSISVMDPIMSEWYDRYVRSGGYVGTDGQEH